MATRQGTKRFPSDEVQGEGSYVVIKQLSVKDAREWQAQWKGAEDDEAQFALGTELIRGRVQEWDWVDFDGTPLPQPKDDPSAIDKLLINELKFLVEALTGGERVKN